MAAYAVKAEHDAVDTIVDEVPVAWLTKDTEVSIPDLWRQPEDDADRGAICPLILDAMLGYAHLTSEYGETVAIHTLDEWADHHAEWLEHTSERFSDDAWYRIMEEVAAGDMEFIGC